MERTKAGFVYVAQMEGHPYFKIGRTVNLSHRIGQIRTQLPGRLKLIFAYYVADAWRVESNLHEDFNSRRLNGEWFRLDENCLDEIRAALLFSQADYTVLKLRQTLDPYKSLDHKTIGRIARLLNRAIARSERRFSHYGDIHYGRREKEIDVLLAEIVQ